MPYDEEMINSKKEWRVREANLKNPIKTKEDIDSEDVTVTPAEVEKNKLEVDQTENLNDEELVKEFAEAGEESVKEKPIMYDDYQLGEALNVLKALVVVTTLSNKGSSK